VTQGIRRHYDAVDYKAIAAAYPPPPEYYETAWYDDPDTIARRQLQRLKEKARQAYAVPFFKERWDAAGFSPDDIRTLDDLWKAPSYTVDDIRKSIDAHPPYGHYQGVTPADARREPMRVYMSGGTTGKSRPTFYTAWDREVGAVFTARALYMQGIRPGDVVLNSWLYGLHNGAFCFDEALHHWLNCVVLTTSTGTVTSTEKQVDLAAQYGARAILTTGDYLLRMHEIAQARGLRLTLGSLPNVGDVDVLTATFPGIEYFRSYGFHEVQWVSVECPAHQGLHIFEDGFVIQIVDPETGEPLPDGQLGSLCVTEIYKTGSPQFRYNIMDLSFLYPPGQCECGSWLRRMGPFSGRGDNMVKLRGVNVWPEGVGEIATAVDGVLPDYFVTATRDGSRDQLTIAVTSDRPSAEFPGLVEQIERRLHDQLGVRVGAEVVGPGQLDDLTEIHTSPKPKRFKDERPKIGEGR
jgi:phenylacetate-CoA ligase